MKFRAGFEANFERKTMEISALKSVLLTQGLKNTASDEDFTAYLAQSLAQQQKAQRAKSATARLFEAIKTQATKNYEKSLKAMKNKDAEEILDGVKEMKKVPKKDTLDKASSSNSSNFGDSTSLNSSTFGGSTSLNSSSLGNFSLSV